LAELSEAVVAALRRGDADGACAICLARWAEGHKALVPAPCGHAVHVDCFWALVTGPRVSASYVGCCRSCRAPHCWGPLALSNLVCTLVAAVAPALAPRSGGSPLAPDEVAEICTRIAEELRAPSGMVLQKLIEECVSRGEPLSRADMAASKAALRRLAPASSGGET